MEDCKNVRPVGGVLSSAYSTANSDTNHDQKPSTVEPTELLFKVSPDVIIHSSSGVRKVGIDSNISEESKKRSEGEEKKEYEKEFETKAEPKYNGIGLFIVDNILTAFVIGPMTVLFWQGLWDLLGRNVFPDSDLLNWLVCSLMGNVGILTAAFSQTILSAYLKPTGLVDWGLGYHFYTYLLGFFNVSQWRGLWIMLDLYTGRNAQSAWASFLAGYFMLCVFRCLRTAEAPPMAVTMDTEPDFFRHCTRFNTKPKPAFKYVLDTLFTVVIIQQLVVVYWRGAWGLMDEYVYPDDPHHSAIVTLISSYILQIIVCIVQPFFNAAYRRVHGNVRRTALEHALFSVANLIAIAHWRSIWMLSAANFLPETPNLGCSISHAFGIIVLMLMLCGNSVVMKGCEVDGKSTPEDGCYCPNKYFRYFHELRLARTSSQQDSARDTLLLSNVSCNRIVVNNFESNTKKNSLFLVTTSAETSKEFTSKTAGNNNNHSSNKGMIDTEIRMDNLIKPTSFDSNSDSRGTIAVKRDRDEEKMVFMEGSKNNVEQAVEYDKVIARNNFFSLNRLNPEIIVSARITTL